MKDQASQSKFDWQVAGLFVFNLLTGLLLIGGSLVSALFVILGGALDGGPISENQLISSLLFSTGLGFAGLLVLPTIYYSGRRLLGYPPRPVKFIPGSKWLFLFLPSIIFMGYLSQTGPTWSKYALPLFHILANGLGILWLLNIIIRKLPLGSVLRYWGSFGGGLVLAPMIAFGVEILLLVMLGVFWMIFLQSQPELRQDIASLINRIQQSSLTPEIIDRYTNTLLEQPGVIGTGFIYIAVLIPLVEELIKPTIVWLMLGRNPSPRTGFLMGAIAGAGYALFENLTIGAEIQVWTFVTITRLGTAAVHILTTGIVGWGIASAWTEKRYTRLALALFSSITFHGTWNGLNILTALSNFPEILKKVGPFGIQFAGYAPVGLVILALGALGGLIRINSYYQRAIIPQVDQEK